MTDSKGTPPAISRRDLLRTAGAAGAAALIPDTVGAVTEESPATSSPRRGRGGAGRRAVAIRHGAVTRGSTYEFDGQ